MSKVKVKDRGWDRIKRDLAKYHRGVAASVGVQGTEASEDHDGITNAELAGIHEFGTKDGTIPERPHIRKAFDDNEDKYSRELKHAAFDFFTSDARFRGDLLLLGEAYKADIINAIKSGLKPDLKNPGPRAGGVPLWRHGYYVNSFTAVVVDVDDKKADQ